MSNAGKIAIVALLTAAVAVAIAFKQGKSSSNGDQVAVQTTNIGSETSPSEPQTDIPAEKPQSAQALPRLIDLGAGKCVPCKMMMPILEELRQEYKGKLEVTVIDITKDTAAAEQYDIWVIPTQLFFDASGKELFRHEGFFSKEDILAKWAELGIDLTQAR